MSDNENVTVALDQNELLRTQQPSTSSGPIGMYLISGTCPNLFFFFVINF